MGKSAKNTRTTVEDMRGQGTLRSGLVSGQGANATDFEDCEIIGEGQYGVVHTMREKLTGQSRVVKTVTRPPTWDEKQLKMEAEILQNLDHPHILRVFSWYEDQDCINIVMEHCEGGELFKIVKTARARGDELSELWAATALRQCFEGLVYIHSKGVVHKDLKGENLMLLQSTEGPLGMYNSLPHMIICDLGLAEVCGRGMFGLAMRARHVAGTPGTMAPEVWKGSFGPKCDIWSMGCVMFELFTGKLPFRPAKNEEALWFEQFRKGPEWGLMTTSEDSVNLCRALLVVKENKRLSAAEALAMPWTKNYSAKTTFTQADAITLCNAVALWRERNPMQRALCLKMAAGATCLKKLAGFFSSFDDDSSGVLESAEIVPMLVSIGIEADLARDTANALDVNGDGSCEYIEFAAACLSSLEEQYDELLRAEFMMLDTKTTGELDRDQMDKMMKELEPLAAAHGLTLQDIDENGDGSIDFEEFCGFFGRPGVKYKRDPGAVIKGIKEQIRILPDASALEDFKKSTRLSMQRSDPRSRSDPKSSIHKTTSYDPGNKKNSAEPLSVCVSGSEPSDSESESECISQEVVVPQKQTRVQSPPPSPWTSESTARGKGKAAPEEVLDRIIARMRAPAPKAGSAMDSVDPNLWQVATPTPAKAASEPELGAPLGERLSRVSSSSLPEPPKPDMPIPDAAIIQSDSAVMLSRSFHASNGQSRSMDRRSSEAVQTASCTGCTALWGAPLPPRRGGPPSSRRTLPSGGRWGVCSL